MVLVCIVILQDHVIQESCDFRGMTPHSKSHLLTFGGQWHHGNRDVMF